MSQLITKSYSVEDAILQASLDYEVRKVPIYAHDVTHGPAVIPVPDQFCLVNAQTGIPIGKTAGVTVGKRYTVIQNWEHFGIGDGLVERGGVISRAGSWDGGKYCDMTFDFGTIQGPDGRDVRKEITVKVGHDGKSSNSATMWMWRQVCQNGMMGWGHGNVISIRHTSGYRDKLEEANRILMLAEDHYVWFMEQLHKMGRVRISTSRMLDLLDELIPDNPNAKRHTRTRNKRMDILGYAIHGQGNRGETLYDLYNGIVEYVDHHKDGDNHVKSLHGSGALFKQRAGQMLIEVANG